MLKIILQFRSIYARHLKGLSTKKHCKITDN